MAMKWFLDRAREPSTYQGLALLSGVLGSWLLGSPEMGVQALEVALAIAGAIGVVKREAIAGRDTLG